MPSESSGDREKEVGLQPGQPFNPYGMFTGIFIPEGARTEMVNSLACCSQAIAAEAQSLINAMGSAHGATQLIEQVRGFITKNAKALRNAGHLDFAAALEAIDVDALYSDFERLEQHLAAIEEEMIATLRVKASDSLLREMGRALERERRSYRDKMTAEQLAMLERKFSIGGYSNRQHLRGSVCSTSDYLPQVGRIVK